MQAGRDSNSLTFDLQEELRPPIRRHWMREFYRHARAIFRRRSFAVEQARAVVDDSGLIRSFRDWRSRLSNSEFTVVRERVLLRTPQPSPAIRAASRLFEFVARHGIPLSLDAERRVREAYRSGPRRFDRL